jgi:hypothetical protein
MSPLRHKQPFHNRPFCELATGDSRQRPLCASDRAKVFSANCIALMHVFKKLRAIDPRPAAVIDAPSAPAIRIVVEAGHPKPRTSSEGAVKVPAPVSRVHPCCISKAPGLAGLGRPYAALTRTQLAGRRVDSASGLGRLRHVRKSGAVARRAFDLGRCFIGFRNVHGNHFLDTMTTASMSLCITDCWLRLSHFKVTPRPSRSILHARHLESSAGR